MALQGPVRKRKLPLHLSIWALGHSNGKVHLSRGREDREDPEGLGAKARITLQPLGPSCKEESWQVSWPECCITIAHLCPPRPWVGPLLEHLMPEKPHFVPCGADPMTSAD